MSKKIKPLTRKEILAKPSSFATSTKPDARNDGNGLTLLVYPSGRRKWRSRYRLNGKRKDWVFDTYEKVDEVEARRLNAEYQQFAKDGRDPRKACHADSGSKVLTFKVIAEELLARRALENKKDKQVIRRLNKHAFPTIGNMPHQQITKTIMQESILNPLIDNETYAEAKKVKTALSLVFDYAISEYEIIDVNPAKKLYHPVYKSKPFHALTDEKPLSQLLKDIWSYKEQHKRAYIHTQSLMKLSLWLFLRPSELRLLKWTDYNEEDKVLHAYASKVDLDHDIPLPVQAVQEFELLKNNRITGNEYIFCSHISGVNKPLSDGTVNQALSNLGYKGTQTAHGFRATARTIMDEELEYSTKYLESQLTHRNQDKLKGSYNRSQYKKQRGYILQKWANYLDALRLDEDVERFKPDHYKTAEQRLHEVFSEVGKEKFLSMVAA